MNIKIAKIEPNAIAAREAARKSIVESIAKDLNQISHNIQEYSARGKTQMSYQIEHKENMDLIIHALRVQGYKVKRNWICHSAYNEIEVKW